jgi:hypothetical protein
LITVKAMVKFLRTLSQNLLIPFFRGIFAEKNFFMFIDQSFSGTPDRTLDIPYCNHFSRAKHFQKPITYVASQ